MAEKAKSCKNEMCAERKAISSIAVIYGCDQPLMADEETIGKLLEHGEHRREEGTRVRSIVETDCLLEMIVRDRE